MFTLLCVPVGLLVVVDFPIMFSSSKDDMPMDTPATQRPFSQPASLDQQLRSLVPPLGRSVHTALVSMLSFLSRSGLGSKAIPIKFNFGVGTGGRDMNLVAMELWMQLVNFLVLMQSLHKNGH